MQSTRPDAGSVPSNVELIHLSYSVPEVCRHLGGVARSYANELIASGELPSFKLGRRRLVAHDDLVAFIDRARRRELEDSGR